MNKLIIIACIMFHLPSFSQTQVIYQDAQHGDTAFQVKITNTLSLDSVTRYTSDSTQYKYYFYNITATQRDSTQLNNLTTSQLNNTANFVNSTRLADTSGTLRTWSGSTKQSTLVSGTNIKTVNGSSLLGSGDIAISGSAAWGSVTGTMSNQTDLSDALAAKEPTITAGISAQYWRGDKTWQTFPTTTAAFTNSANKNFVTDAQATVIGNTSGANTGDNAANTTYANDYRAANFVAGTNYLATNGNGSALTNLTKSQVGLTNADNTSDANKPVSTATQTALDGKQATLVSATNIKTINGASVLGSGDLVVSGGAGLGYTLSVQALTSSPADGQTIYFGQLPKAPVTAAATSKIYIRKAGTIKIAQIYCYSGTAGTAEAWVMNIRLNNTTDTQIASVSLGTSERIFTNSSLSIAVSAGDYIEIKCVNPTWATNPLTTIFGGYIYIE